MRELTRKLHCLREYTCTLIPCVIRKEDKICEQETSRVSANITIGRSVSVGDDVMMLDWLSTLESKWDLKVLEKDSILIAFDFSFKQMGDGAVDSWHIGSGVTGENSLVEMVTKGVDVRVVVVVVVVVVSMDVSGSTPGDLAGLLVGWLLVRKSVSRLQGSILSHQSSIPSRK